MKCPKCGYLGFETGDRCRNCGYDFSLLAMPREAPGELALKPAVGEDADVGELWLDRQGPSAGEGPALLASESPVVPVFPLFPPLSGDIDDEPLIKLPAEPRAPLAVRRAPDQPRSRTLLKAQRHFDAGLTLEFAEEPPIEPRPQVRPVPEADTLAPHASTRRRGGEEIASLQSRTVAALIDHALLLGIDLLVVASTLRMTGLATSEWQALPPVPFLAFLVLLKVSYFSAFTAMGGQTIGKMAAGIRVVADDHLRLDPARAIGRTLTGALSLLSLGLGLIPALVGAERRTFHDRVARTHVVDVPSA